MIVLMVKGGQGAKVVLKTERRERGDIHHLIRTALMILIQTPLLLRAILIQILHHLKQVHPVITGAGGERKHQGRINIEMGKEREIGVERNNKRIAIKDLDENQNGVFSCICFHIFDMFFILTWSPFYVH